MKTFKEIIQLTEAKNSIADKVIEHVRKETSANDYFLQNIATGPDTIVTAYTIDPDPESGDSIDVAKRQAIYGFDGLGIEKKLNVTLKLIKTVVYKTVAQRPSILKKAGIPYHGPVMVAATYKVLPIK